MLMPSSWARCGVAMSTGCPSSRTRPCSRDRAPAKIFIRVDLPAPFSPTRAWTSPGNTSKETSSRARTPGKSLVMDSISSTGCWVSFSAGRAKLPRAFHQQLGQVARGLAPSLHIVRGDVADHLAAVGADVGGEDGD